MSGSGRVSFRGGGTVHFEGSAFAGPVFLNGADLILARGVSSAAAFTVGADSTLSGAGTIGALTVNDGGVVSPGYSPGTLQVSGSVAFNSGSTYRADVAPGHVNDLIAAGGALSIADGSRLDIKGARGSYANSWTFTILSAAGGVSGAFSEATSNFAFLDPLLTYGSTFVDVTLVRKDIPFAAEAFTQNQWATAVALESLGAGNAVYDAVASQLKGEAHTAFDALSGEAYASVETVMQQQSAYVRDGVTGRLRQAFAIDGAGGPATAGFGGGLALVMWVQGFGGWGETFSDGNAASISNSIGGVLGGVDAPLGENWRIGAYGGYSASWFDVSARASSGSMDNYNAGLYAGARYGQVALRLGGGYAWHDVSLSRSVAFPGYAAQVSSGYTGGEAQLFGQVGYDFSANGLAFEPFAGLAYVHLEGASAVESWSSAALDVSTGAMDTLYGTLGLRIAAPFDLAGHTVTPSLMAGWQHAFGDIIPEASMRFAGGSTPFSVLGAPIAIDTAVVLAGLGYALSPLATLTLKYDGQIASSAVESAFTGQLQIRF